MLITNTILFENSEISRQNLKSMHFTTDFASNLGSNFNRFESSFFSVFSLPDANKSTEKQILLRNRPG